MRTRPEFDVAKLRDDMSERGWMPTDLARAAGVSDMAVTRFFRGEHRTARMAKKFADALGRPVRRYLIRSTQAVA
jgi:transcriptional regulator with XRE-family HTH domain